MNPTNSSSTSSIAPTRAVAAPLFKKMNQPNNTSSDGQMGSNHSNFGGDNVPTRLSSAGYNTIRPINEAPPGLAKQQTNLGAIRQPGSAVAAPLYKKIEQPSTTGFDRQMGNHHSNFGSDNAGVGNGNGNMQRGGGCPAFQGHQGNLSSGQRSWNGRSSGEGSLFGGPGSMKRKTMSPEGKRTGIQINKPRGLRSPLVSNTTPNYKMKGSKLLKIANPVDNQFVMKPT